MAKLAAKLAVPAANADSSRTVEYLSPPATVSMADAWFEIASADHFWIRRRFQVLRKLADQLIATAGEMAEIGCGNGLLQRGIEDTYQREVTGFDLNDYALRKNVSLRSRVCCYDIFQKNANLRSRYDLIFLFDVLEHIAEEDAFLQATLFHLKPNGRLIINVPAGEWAFSAYDAAAGHVRRYSIATLSNSLRRNNMHAVAATYWGLPLVPTLALRKLWLMRKHDANEIISTGFDSRPPFLNRMLAALSSCEILPQQLLGTSVMAVFFEATQGVPRPVQE